MCIIYGEKKILLLLLLCVWYRTIKKLDLIWRNSHLVTSLHLSHCLSGAIFRIGEFGSFSPPHQARWSFSIRETGKLPEEKTVKDFSCRGLTKNATVLHSFRAFCWHLLQFAFFVEFFSTFVYYRSAIVWTKIKII